MSFFNAQPVSPHPLCWKKVLTKNCELDKELTLRCDRHHQQTVKVKLNVRKYDSKDKVRPHIGNH
ncbi:hypothetical protein DAPPUDRAFT_330045 [Daphnia pulex]|uniref:Uncharacterized protein n=1 Tax=Daphnia pulex TaxID=6669 RepID=E9HIE3_DAPPU|nr:hypothetical protein DAPPUDRAFT_330045 [Daphnia pulex]|eukprot:EFX68486.1 hypothetical protein DAPPUDRAFT_330045 [Daphnia pulex]